MKKTRSNRKTTDAAPAFTDTRDPEALARHLSATLDKAGRPLDLDAILRITRLPRKAKKSVLASLASLESQGRLVRASGGWAPASRLKHAEGVLTVQRAGMGFVAPLTGKGPDIYIHPLSLGDAWHGDTVEVAVLPGKRGPSREGRVLRIIHRAMQEVAVYATRRQRNGEWVCVPADPRVQALFMVEEAAGEADAPKDGQPPSPPVRKDDLLLVRPLEKTGPGVWRASLAVNLQHQDTPAAQERLTKVNHAIPTAFPHSALVEAASLPEHPGEADFAGRRDLRGEGFVTIDGRTAKDFDDAILVSRESSEFRLLVAIADVSHYVLPGSALDNEARIRGNSYYFPLSVEPMLPEALSNNLCSLKPLVPRLVMTADLRFTPEGEPANAAFYPAVIQSEARLTYGQIQRALLLDEPEEKETLAPHLPMLREAEALARVLLARRRERGSLDFDLPEPGIRFTDGKVAGVFPRERHFGHQIIEECMIAANEAVARFLESKDKACLYRVHEPPDPEKLSMLLTFLSETGLAAEAGLFPKGRKKNLLPTAGDLIRIMKAVSGTPSEYTVNRLVLRSMMQARYSTENDGHFGLASSCYCHFTSPIRRYADLTVHRSLKGALGLPLPTDQPLPGRDRLESTAAHINATERAATQAEREIHKRLTILYLKENIGEELDGVISGITDFGIFVELPLLLTEGMIPLTTLNDDYYLYLPERQELRGKNTRRTFRPGQKLRVRVTDVNQARLEINLALTAVTR